MIEKVNTDRNIFFYIQLILLQVASIIGLFTIYTLSSKPKESEGVDDFLWKKGKRDIKNKFYLSLFLLFWAISLILADFLLFGSTFQIISFIGAPLCFATYYLVVIYIIDQPRLIESRVTIVSSLVFAFGFRFLASIFLILYNTIGAPDLLAMYVIFNLVFTIELVFLFAMKGRLNRTQSSIIRIIKPSDEDLYDILASESQKKEDKKHSAIISEMQYQHITYENRVGVRKYLIEERLKEKSEKGNRVKGWLIVLGTSLIVFVFTSIAEGLIQDVFNESIKDFFKSLFK